MPRRVEGWSGKSLSSTCPNCKAKKFEIVQIQNYLGFGNIRLLGLGPRYLMAECKSCGQLVPLSDQQKEKARRLKYGDSNPDKMRLLSSTSKKYPVLTQERRSQIRKDNIKEGISSMVIGMIISVVILVLPFRPWSLIGGLVFLVYSILGGLYAILEDPERKHRDLINNAKKL